MNLSLVETSRGLFRVFEEIIERMLKPGIFLFSDLGKCTKSCASLRTESRKKQKDNQIYMKQRLGLEDIDGLGHFKGAEILSLLSQNQTINVLFKTPIES